jgi:hypothetical protein
MLFSFVHHKPILDFNQNFAKMDINFHGILKLCKTVGKIIKYFNEPKHIKQIADAKAYEITTISEALRNNSDLPIKYDNGKLLIRSDNNITNDQKIEKEIQLEKIGNRIMFQDIRKQKNMESVIYKAFQELENEQFVSEEPVDTDWTVRFFKAVEDIGNEDMQKIWGKILASEVKQPKSYSLRTLDILRNISKDEAELFTKISTLVIYNNNDYFIPNEKSLYEKYDISFNDLYNIKESRLIDITSTLTLKFTLKNNGRIVLFNKQVVGVCRNIEQSINITLSVYFLTESGKQLYNILNLNSNSNKNFAIDYFKFLKNKHKTLQITAYNNISTNEDELKYDNTDLLATSNIPQSLSEPIVQQ